MLRSVRGRRVQQGPAYRHHRPAGNVGDQADGVVPGSKGVQVTCVEFTFFQAAGGGRLLSQEIVVGEAKPRGRPRGAVLSRAEFLEACDDHGRAVYSRILDLANREGRSLNWGATSFSVVVVVDGRREPACTGGLPGSRYTQAVWTSLGSDYWGIRRTGAPEEVVEQLWKQAEQTGLFDPAGKELKCLIDRAFTDDEVDALVAWCESAMQAIREHGQNAAAVQPQSG